MQAGVGGALQPRQRLCIQIGVVQEVATLEETLAYVAYWPLDLALIRHDGPVSRRSLPLCAWNRRYGVTIRALGHWEHATRGQTEHKNVG